MKNLISYGLLLLSFAAFAQNEAEAEKTLTIDDHETILLGKFNDIINQPFGDLRKQLNYGFIPALVEALKMPNSFSHRFDKLEGVSSIYAPDSTFRIFTWAIPEGDKTLGEDASEALSDDQNFRYFGAIQLNRDELSLTPLIDFSEQMSDPASAIVTTEEWYGCVYYNIAMKQGQDRTYYTLFGWDGNTRHSDRKIADVLYVENGKIFFGAPIFEVNEETETVMRSRFILEYKEGSAVSLNYDADNDAVIFDFIAPQTEESRGMYPTYVPDGTYDGMIFENGYWAYRPKIYDFLGISQEIFFEAPSLNTTAPGKKNKRKRNKRDRKKKGKRAKKNTTKQVNPWDKGDS